MIIYLKRFKSSKFVRVKAFPMYGGIGVSAPFLHRESTDSLINHFYAVFVWRPERQEARNAPMIYASDSGQIYLHIQV